MTNEESNAASTPPGIQQAVVGEPTLLGSTTLPGSSSSSEQVVQSGKGRRVGLAAALLAVTGMGAFAVSTALSEPAGPQSPEEALEEFFAAVGNEDLVGMAETILPSERDALITPLLSITSELERLELFGEAIEIDSFGTLDFEVEGVLVSSTLLDPGIAAVRTDAGTIQVHGSTDDVPVMAKITEWFDEQPEEFEDAIVDLAEEPIRLVAVEDNGSWYLSLFYSAAEQARKDSGLGLPNFGEGPVPVGAPTPEGAVENFVNELVALNLEGMITQLDPEEMRALYDYSPLFVPDAQAEVNELLDGLRSEGLEWSVTNLESHADDARGRTVVVIDGAGFQASSDEFSYEVSFADDCFSYAIDDGWSEPQSETVCEGDQPLPDSGMDLPTFDFDFEGITFPEPGITVVERDGQWYISSIPTALYTYVDILAAIELEQFEQIKTAGQEWFDLFWSEGAGLFGMSGFDATAGQQFSEIDSAISGDFEGDIEFETEYNFVDVNPAYIPEGFDSGSEDTNSWFFDGEVDEPLSAFSIWKGDEDGWVTVAEYPGEEPAQGVMAQILGAGYEGDLDKSVSTFSVVERSGRFIVTYWNDETDSAVAQAVIAHLAGL